MVQPLIPPELVGAKRQGSHAGGRVQKYILDDIGRRLLLASYDGTTQATDDLMRRHFTPLGIPRHRVRQWASQLGLARQKEPPWAEEEIAYLERNLAKKSLADIARHLGRTKTAVRLKAKRIGVNKCYQEGYTMRGLCEGLGCNHHAVERWMRAGWLKGVRRRTERAAEWDVWHFSDNAIRDFVRTHPQEIDPRRADWLWLVDVLLGGIGELSKQRGESEAS